jgi:ATP-dependent DNA helicase RecG
VSDASYQAPPRLAAEDHPITTLKGVGAALAERLKKLGLYTIQDALFLLPTRYEDRTQVIPMGELRVGDRAVVEGHIELAEVVFRKRRQLLVRIADGSGFLTLRFFHFSAQQHAQLERGTRLRVFGELRRGQIGLEMVHPEYKRADGFDASRTSDSLTPVYPTTEGVQQGRLRIVTAQALAFLEKGHVREWLPQELLRSLQLPGLQESLLHVHRPPPGADVELLQAGQTPWQKRLAFEELLAHQLSLKRVRLASEKEPAFPLISTHRFRRHFLEHLPFELTKAQCRVDQEIQADLIKPSPMMRLVQGDVGSGKTVVAALAALSAIEAGFQAALMAPTELLAEQHARNFRHWFQPLNLPVALLNGRLTGKARQSALNAIATSTDVPMVIGTHALFQEGVKFSRLGLMVVDEQHRFGVRQRLALKSKGVSASHVPHQLIMTATPIPRTLAQTAYADLDVSIIDELPPGRTPVQTIVVNQNRRDEVVARIALACREGRQAYWVCPLIEESEELDCQAAEVTFSALKEALPQLKIGLAHGRLTSAQKERVMSTFSRGELDLLVATTVIEVGVDVPNASLMVIENAERLGLSQLHQLRGRVGRGSVESSCVLLYKPPLSQMARARLDVMRSTNDGFEVARRDLELRGPGELLGTRQTGLLVMRVAELRRDANLLPSVQLAAESMMMHYADRVPPLLRRWFGDGEQLSRV